MHYSKSGHTHVYTLVESLVGEVANIKFVILLKCDSNPVEECDTVSSHTCRSFNRNVLSWANYILY